MSYTSALETIDHLVYSFDMKYIEEDIYIKLRKDIDQIINKLNALYKYHLSKNHDLKSKLGNERQKD